MILNILIYVCGKAQQMKTAFCTISTHSHVFKSKAMLESVRSQTKTDLFCLITDEIPTEDVGDGIHWQGLDVLNGLHAKSIVEKYSGNSLRWACKPLYLEYLLKQGYDAVIYGDNDLYFYASADFLFEKLNTSDIILTPHFYLVDYEKNQDQLEANFRVGLFNAGFIGVSKNALTALNWWAGCCKYNVKQAAHRGLFDDQKYLDLFPILFDGVEILKHRGCNVAAWNQTTSQRSVQDGKVVLCASFPLVFIHYNIFTIRGITEGSDFLLLPCLDMYEKVLQRHKPEYAIRDELKRDKSMRKARTRNFWWRWERRFD